MSAKLSTYRTWRAMLNRCNSPRDPRYRDYGGRGINVCDRWKSFNSFLADMGERPANYLQLDRIDNNGDYSPKNCRWATPSENRANARLPARATNNASGVTGVSLTKRGYWRAFGGRELLYQGASFEAACSARKSWELRRATGDPS